MPIHQALQLAYALKEQRAGQFDGRRGSNQILGQHLLPVLRREQAALRSRFALGLQDRAEFSTGLFANLLQLVFGCTHRQGRAFGLI